MYIVASRDERQIFVTGHSEYDAETLKLEYLRDKAKGLDTAVPENYFPNDDPEQEPLVRWRAHANLLLPTGSTIMYIRRLPTSLKRSSIDCIFPVFRLTIMDAGDDRDRQVNNKQNRLQNHNRMALK